MKKKFLIVCLICMFSLASCSSDSDKNTVNQKENTESEETTKTDSISETDSEAQSATPETSEHSNLPDAVQLCYESFEKVLESYFPNLTLSEIETKYQNGSKFYSFNINTGTLGTQPNVTFYNEESSFKLSLPDNIENSTLISLIQATITSCESLDESSAKDLTQQIVNGFDGKSNSKIIETENYKFYISPGSGTYLRYLNVISEAEINPPIEESEYVQATNDLFSGELNQGTKAYFKGTISGNYDLGTNWGLEVSSESETYVVYYDYDSFINCFEVGKTYTFYGQIAAARQGYAGCLRLDHYSSEK